MLTSSFRGTGERHAYITYRIARVVTYCSVKEITGCSTPIMRELMQGLAEVYYLADPSLPDNLIVKVGL